MPRDRRNQLVILWENALCESSVRRSLRALSRQRCAMILEPGNVWVIENAVANDTQTRSNLNTCCMRGWAEVLHQAIPTGSLLPDGSIPAGFFDRHSTTYRLTDSGWAVINRVMPLSWVSLSISCLSFVVAVASAVTSLRHTSGTED
jgi:hypothetical protein